ncbi:unnamed protein product [Arabidopsis thaliana]|uniref:Uncharacterized protein n=1 Tax=Arabidopsis thaliana TaxID=3702 RepID=A0A5S9XH74_ARATH|nr:unnamed protein product [Arabidopsis thaliana]
MPREQSEPSFPSQKDYLKRWFAKSPRESTNGSGVNSGNTSRAGRRNTSGVQKNRLEHSQLDRLLV